MHSDHVTKTSDWSKTQIFLRVREEDCSAVIDTAMKHMDGVSIPFILLTIPNGKPSICCPAILFFIPSVPLGNNS